jgi:hypothetical protein
MFLSMPPTQFKLMGGGFAKNLPDAEKCAAGSNRLGVPNKNIVTTLRRHDRQGVLSSTVRLALGF